MGHFKMWTCSVVPESVPGPRVMWTDISADMHHCHGMYLSQGGHWLRL